MYQLVFQRPDYGDEWWHLAGMNDDLEAAVYRLLDQRAISALPSNPHFGWRYKLIYHPDKEDINATYNAEDGIEVPEESVIAVAIRGIHA